MQLKNYIIKGKPLGFTSNNIGEIVQEVLLSYLPLAPTKCMLTGKPILTQPKIVFLDGDSENILFSNILFTSVENNTNKSFQHEVILKFRNRFTVKFWSFDDFPYMLENNIELIKKYCKDSSEENPLQMFLDLISIGVKGLIFVCIDTEEDILTTKTLSCHYQDIIRFRKLNPTNIVSLSEN
jgi:hypothetical protein